MAHFKKNFIYLILINFLCFHLVLFPIYGMDPLIVVDVEEVNEVTRGPILRVMAFDVADQRLIDVAYAQYDDSGKTEHAISLRSAKVPLFVLSRDGSIYFGDQEQNYSRTSKKILFRTRGSLNWIGKKDILKINPNEILTSLGDDEREFFLNSFRNAEKVVGVPITWIDMNGIVTTICFEDLVGRKIRGVQKDSKLEKGRIGEVATEITMGILFGYRRLPSQMGNDINQGQGFDGVWLDPEGRNLIITESKFQNRRNLNDVFYEVSDASGFLKKMGSLTGDDRENTRNKVVEFLRRGTDGGYYSIEGVENLHNKGITPVIPPPSHAVVHGKTNTSWHDKIVQYIKDKGTVYAFHKKYGYGVRSLVESQISRIKRCIGISLQTQRLSSQKREGIIISNIINLWNSFGKPVSVKIG